MSAPSTNGSGITFGNYEVVAKDDGTPVLLGGGSYGKTYRAVHSFLGSTVALKVIHDSFAFDAGVKKRFLAEAKAMAQLRHAHVAQILNCGEEDGTLYYAVEYCDSGDLEHVVRKLGALKPGTVLALARQAAEALTYVHENGFLHRDLKPSNLMLATPPEGGEARLKVIDFGLVKQYNGEHATAMTQTGQFLGTMLFASPEQLREEPLDARSDIFSLGLTLWFMLKGGTPFPGKPAQVVAQRLSGKSYVPDLPPNLPPALHSLLARMVALDVQSRPASMREVLTAIDACSQQMVQAESPLAQLTQAGDVLIDPDPEFFTGGTSVHLTSVERLTGDCYAIDSEQMEVDFGVRHRGRRLPSGKVVALTLVRKSFAASPVFVQHLERTVQRASECGGPNLIRPNELVRFRDHLVLVEEWVQGLDLLTLLRQRKTISLMEALPVVRQLADACDLAKAAQLAKLEIAAHRVILQFEKLPWPQLDAAAQNQLLSQPLSQWPPFTIRIAPTYTVEERATGPATLSQLPQLTVVGGGEQDADLTSRYGRLIYRIVSGHPALATATVSRSAYVSVAGLTEESNEFLSHVIAGDSRHTDCVSILEELWTRERLSPATFRSSAPSPTATTRPGTSRAGTGTPVVTATASRPGSTMAPGRGRSSQKVSTIPVTPMAPAAAAQVPALDLHEAKPVAADPPSDGKPRVIPLGKKAAPVSEPPPQQTRPPIRPGSQPQPPANAPAAKKIVESEFWAAPRPGPASRSVPPPMTPQRPPPPQGQKKFPLIPVVIGSVAVLAVIIGLVMQNRPAAEDDEYEPYSTKVERFEPKRPVTTADKIEEPVRKEELGQTTPAPPPATSSVPVPASPAPSTPVATAPSPSSAPQPALAALVAPPPSPGPASAPVASTPSSASPSAEPSKPSMPVAVAPAPSPAPVAPPPPAPPAPPPAPVDPVAEQEKAFALSRSPADAQKLLALLEPKLGPSTPLADRARLARRIAELWRVTKADDRTLEWKLYQHFQQNDLNAEAQQALSAARDAGIKNAWVESVRQMTASDPDMRRAQQHLAESWPEDLEGRAAMQWLQTHLEARIPPTALPGQVEDPLHPGRMLTIPREQWKAGGFVSLPENKRWFHLPDSLPKPRAELARDSHGLIIPGAIKSPSGGRPLTSQWAAWKPGATVRIDGETYQMPDDLPPPDLEAASANPTAHTVASPYGGHSVKISKEDWRSGARVTDSEHRHLQFRLPSNLPDWFDVQEARPIEGRYTAVRSPYAQGNEIAVSASAWGEGEVTDPVTRQKVKLPKLADPRLTAEVLDAYSKAVRNPYTQTQETWKDDWSGGASKRWGNSGFSYRLPSPLPSATVETATFSSYSEIKSPYSGERVSLSASDWVAGTVTPKKGGRPFKLPEINDPKLEARIVDIPQQQVVNPYTNEQITWQGSFTPKATTSWAKFTMKLPSDKNAFKEQVTVPNNMRRGFQTPHGIWFGWKKDGYWMTDKVPTGGDMAETCRVMTEYAQQKGLIPLDYQVVFDGTSKLMAQRVRAAPAKQTKR